MPDFELGVDYGTSNTVAMLRWSDGRVRQLLVDGASMLPSAVYAEDGRRLLVGREAERNARLDPGRFEPNPKRRIDDGDVLLGEESFAVVDVIAATLARVLEQAVRAGNGPPTKITLTYPASWQQTRQAILVEAAAHAGMAPVSMVPEPVAAGRYFATGVQPVPPGLCLVVYDLGAGTFDATLLRATAEGFDVLAVDGLDDFGGLDLDALVVDRVAAALADQPDWRRLALPATTQDRRHRRALWEDACAARESLSQRSSAGLYVPLFDRDFYLSREEFERAAEPQLRRTVERTARLIETRRVAASDIAAVLLVGGASRTPLIATLLHRRLGIAPTVMEQPELLVAEGALYDAPHDPAPVPAPIVVEPVTADESTTERAAEPPPEPWPEPLPEPLPAPEDATAGSPPAEPQPARVWVAPTPVPPGVRKAAGGTGRAARSAVTWSVATRTRKWLLIAVVVLAVAVGATALAVQLSEDDFTPAAGSNRVSGGGGTGGSTGTQPTPGAGSPSPTSTPSCRDLSSRRCDPTSLSVREVAPSSSVTLISGERPFVVRNTSLDSDCSDVVRTALVSLLERGGCSQVLRVLLRSADGDHYVILGIFNMEDSAAARKLWEDYLQSVKGNVFVLNEDTPVDELRNPVTHTEYRYRGHFYYYGVGLRANGSSAPASADPRLAEIAKAGAEYLKTVIDRRP